MHTTRARRLLVALLALGFVAAACSDSNDSPSTSASREPGRSEPVRGGTFVVGLSPPLPAQGTLNPAVNTQGGMQQAAGLLFSGLVEVDEKAQPVPELATKWDIRDGGTTYVFTLRDGVTFSDGSPLTAGDVKWSYEGALLRNHARTQSSIGPALSQPCAAPPAAPSCPSIEAVEAAAGQPATVTFRFAKPYAPLLQQLSHTEGAIVPKKLWDGKPPPTAATPWPPGQNPVGTGPFKFVSHDASQIVYERNPAYFKAGQPYIDRVVQRAVEPAAQAQALAAGEVDWLWSVSGQDLPNLRSNPKIEIISGSQSAGGSTNCVLKTVLNLFQREAKPADVRAGTAPPHPILGDLRVRRAVASALNTEQYVGQVLQGNGTLATSPISSQIAFAHVKAPLPAFDVAAAGKLLDEAGWTSPGAGRTRTRNGQPLVLDMFHFAGNERALATKMTQDLAVVGVEVKQQQVDGAGKNSLYSGRSFDTMIVSHCQLTDPEIGVRRFYHSTAISGAPFTNGAGYRNADVDRLFDEAARELDLKKRGAAYEQVQKQIAADLPYLSLLETVTVRAKPVACRDVRAHSGHFLEAAYCAR